KFESDTELALGHFVADEDGSARGTFETTLGDYRYLAGTFDGEHLQLSCFDGGHAFLFKAELDAGGELKGDFWSRDSWHDGWTARRDPTAKLSDSFGLSAWNSEVALSSLVFPDLQGTPRSLADKAFAGKARIITLFGSWCPNCNDEARFLGELAKQYGPRGLSILGIAFELDTDFARSARQVQRFQERHGVKYPVLIAGESNKQTASKAFPALDRVRAYPTAIILDRNNKVRAVHTGFSGPATAAAHGHMRERYEALLEELLGES
ncbi:MAG: thiol-disulfide isomerase/thioredoxin, partial [Candidatus Paceibacteria bacterium]